ncbi:MAG: hydroxymethylbilane synthase [Endozoicomonadaceae bacterium]|nr:hydroxymethylbilane synthase [Endozoicomonadaceae bacterium]
MIQVLRIATRKSELALWQSHYIGDILKKNHPELSIEWVELSTKADEDLSKPVYQLGGKGLFIKALEQALLDNIADIAVHSMKDVPTILPMGMRISAICQRTDPRDVFVSNQYNSIQALPSYAKIGTTSLRRASQLLRKRPDLHITLLRGNINTRLLKLDQNEYDGLILAAAGLLRLNLSSRIVEYLDCDWHVPASGQGVIGIETCLHRKELLPYLACLHHESTAYCIRIERAMLYKLEAGCESPVGSYAKIDQDKLIFNAYVGHRTGVQYLEETFEMNVKDIQSPVDIGEQMAQRLLDQGASDLL